MLLGDSRVLWLGSGGCHRWGSCRRVSGIGGEHGPDLLYKGRCSVGCRPVPVSWDSMRGYKCLVQGQGRERADASSRRRG